MNWANISQYTKQQVLLGRVREVENAAMMVFKLRCQWGRIVIGKLRLTKRASVGLTLFSGTIHRLPSIYRSRDKEKPRPYSIAFCLAILNKNIAVLRLR